MGKELLREIQALLGQGDFCVLATAGPEGPHTSLMSYLASPDGRLIYLVTARDTRKFRNLAANPRVSLLFDDRIQGERSRNLALNADGTCAPLEDKAEAERILRDFSRRFPQLAGILKNPQCILLQVIVLGFQLLRGPGNAAQFSFAAQHNEPDL